MSRSSALTRFGRSVTRGVLIGVAALAAGALVLPPSAEAASGMLRVFVTNTDADPVPVRGTVTVDNLPGATAAPEPFEARASTTLAAGTGFSSLFIPIPAGQRLTAEFLSVQVILPPDQVPHVSFNASNGTTGGFVPLVASGVTDGLDGPVATYTAAIPILDHHTGNFEVLLARDLPGSFAYPGEAYLSAYVSGYVVPE